MKCLEKSSYNKKIEYFMKKCFHLRNLRSCIFVILLKFFFIFVLDFYNESLSQKKDSST